MKRFTGTKGVLILIILIVSMVAYYGYLSNKTSKQSEEDTTLTKVQNVLLRDLERNYPPTVKEVVKYYGDITLCLYDGQCAEEDIDKLAAKEIQLFDEELVENNPWAMYIVNLKADIASYKEMERIISSYAAAGSTSVDYFTQDHYEWARIYCTFYIKEKNISKAVNEVFLLRKDSDGRWKIYGWELAQNLDKDVKE